MSVKLPSPPGNTRHPLYRRLGGLQSRSVRLRQVLPPTRIRSPDYPACSDWAIPARNHDCKEGKITYIQELILTWNKWNTVSCVKVAHKTFTAVIPYLLYFKVRYSPKMRIYVASAVEEWRTKKRRWIDTDSRQTKC
jgi:hypothetical protein